MSYPPSALAANKTALTKTLTDHPAHHNSIANAINDIVTELGTDPSGASASLTVRLTGITYDGTNNVLASGTKLAGYIDFTPMSAPAWAEGRVFYSTDDKTLCYYTDINGVTMNIGEENWVKGRNTSGVQINNGAVVYISGATGSNALISLADADIVDGAESVIGLVTENIANNAIGRVTTSGLVRGLDTSAWAEGTKLYLSQTAGALTSTRPTPPAHAVCIGIVIYQHANHGQILVHVDTGDDLSLLHDVILTTPAADQFLAYDGTVWRNRSLFSAENSWSAIQNITNTTDCTAADTGALQVQGGVWVEKQLRVGGVALIGNTNGVGVSGGMKEVSTGGKFYNGTTPTLIDHYKLLLYEDSGSNYYGITVSAGALNYMADGTNSATTGIIHRFHCGNVKTDSFIIDGAFCKISDGNFFYLRGNASTDGSVRISSDDSSKSIEEARVSGSWVSARTTQVSGSMRIQMIGANVRIVDDPTTGESGIQKLFVNKTGANSVKGSVVSMSTTTTRGVRLTPANADNAVGIIAESGIADGSNVWVWATGAIAQVLLENSTAATVGYWAKVSDSVAGRADMTISDPPGAVLDHWSEIGHCGQTVTAGTDQLALCELHFN